MCAGIVLRVACNCASRPDSDLVARETMVGIIHRQKILYDQTRRTVSPDLLEPSTAIETVFHTPGLSRSIWSASSGKRFQNLIDRPHPCKARKDVLERKTMLVGVPAGAGVFGDNESEAQAGPLAQCRLDPRVCPDSGEDDGTDVASPQLLLKRRSSERTPMIFCDQKIPILKPGRWRNFRQFTGYVLALKWHRKVNR